MKSKFFALLLTAGILTSCGAPPLASMAEVGQTEMVDASTQTVPVSNIQYQVDMKTYEDTAATPDGVVLATYRAQVPVMTACLADGTPLEEAHTPEGEQALETVEAFNQEFSPWLGRTHLDTLAEDAGNVYEILKADGLSMVGNYVEELSCSVYQTEHIVSVSGLFYSFTGGAHPNTVQMGWNFDLDTGTFFNGVDLIGSSNSFQNAVADELIQQAKAVAEENGTEPEDLFWPEYKSLLKDWSSYTIYFDDSGMTVVFAPYELAPYAAGSQEFKLSYEWLQPRLSRHGGEVLGFVEDGPTD